MGTSSRGVVVGKWCAVVLAPVLLTGHVLTQSQGTLLTKEFVDAASNFSQVVTAESRGVKMIYVSGQVGRGDSYREHVETAFQRVVTRLASVGASPDDVVKIRVYVADFDRDEYADIAEVRSQTFDGENRPTSTMIGVQALFNEQIKVEVEAVAVLASDEARGTFDKVHISPTRTGYSQVVVVTNGGVKTIYVSGQVGQGDDLASQTASVYQRVAERLALAGASLKDLVKTNIYIPDFDPERDLPAFREGRVQVLGSDNLPASTLVGVQSLVSDRFRIEVDAIAVVEDEGAAGALTKEFIDPATGYTRVVTATAGGVKTIYLSGAIGGGEDHEAQIDQVYAGLKTRLQAAGATPADLVKWNNYFVNYTLGDGDVRAAARTKHGFPDSPASTLVGIPSLATTAALIEVEGIAIIEQ